MIASVYIKDGNIHLHNEGDSLSKIGGLAYELGKPLLNFICYEPERFDDAFSIIASAFDNEYAHIGAKEPEFVASMEDSATAMQQGEIYVYFYYQMLMEFVYMFIESPRQAILALEDKIPGAEEKLRWAIDFEWSSSSSAFVEVAIFADKEKRLFRAAMDVVALMFEHFQIYRDAMIGEIELLLNFREVIGAPDDSSMEYLYWMEEYRKEKTGGGYYLERPFRSFYGVIKPPEIVELYEIDGIEDLFRFEFIKMIEHDIFIKKCKNCGWFFIPKRRADTEYCDRDFGETGRKCSEVGATLRYEKKVAGNPILEAHKKAYRRFNSRTRAKKMTQGEFMAWSETAAQKRDECLAGTLPFDEFIAWLEQGRIRKSRNSKSADAQNSD